MAKPNTKKDQLKAAGLRWKECFACMKPFRKYCWVHPLYPGERLCKTCYEQVCKDFKCMWQEE